MEIAMSWELALALGAVLPKNVKEHRAMLREGKHIRVRIIGFAGLAMFWPIVPGAGVAAKDH
jgi:hypothetical protein